MNIRKNDTVVVISGRDKDKKGKVRFAYPKKETLIIEGVNFIHRHTRPRTQGDQGGIIEKEAPIDASNVMLVCTKCDTGVRIRTKILADKTKTRVCTQCGEMIERR